MAEESSEHGAGHLLVLGSFPGPADLSEHLGLTEDRRVETGGHPEEMTGDVVVEADGQVLRQGVDRAAAGRGQKLLELGHAVVEALDHRVDLGAETGREDDHLRQVGLVPQTAEGLGQGALGHRHPVQQIERGVSLLEPDDDHRHGATSTIDPFVACLTESSLVVGPRSDPRFRHVSTPQE